jgi:hypothetical protein
MERLEQLIEDEIRGHAGSPVGNFDDGMLAGSAERERHPAVVTRRLAGVPENVAEQRPGL